jgi:hypothetical protein
VPPTWYIKIFKKKLFISLDYVGETEWSGFPKAEGKKKKKRAAAAPAHFTGGT